MKKNKLIPVIIILIGGLFYFVTNQKEQAIPLTPTNNMEVNTKLTEAIIGFYNVENLFDIYDDPKTFDESFTPTGELHWDEERYNTKLMQIGEMINTIDSENLPIVMGFSEVENYNVLKDLTNIELLKGAGYQIIHKDSPDGRGIDVAAIYRPDAFSINTYSYHPVILPGKNRSTTREILEINGTLSNGENITIFFNHWSSRRKGTIETEPKRIAAAEVLRQKTDLLMAENNSANIFILGDFNDEPSDKSVERYLMKDDFSNLTSQYEHTKMGTVNHRGDWLVFDQIIVSNAAMRNPIFKLTEKSAHIHKTHDNTFTHKDGNQVPSRTYGGEKYYGGYSDHYPVYLTIKLKNT